ncbi:MAG: 50S ribosomal protein L28 [Desulfofundulus sp.]|uniref:50S ribosomal protein L28 n=1 Tax=Desulfofundulus sp. TaxID=2282750 RepID=UPI003C7779FA
MARKCAVCGKGVVVGMQVSHSHIRTKRTWQPNLQRVRALINGTPRRILVCTRCLRSGKVQRAI